MDCLWLLFLALLFAQHVEHACANHGGHQGRVPPHFKRDDASAPTYTPCCSFPFLCAACRARLCPASGPHTAASRIRRHRSSLHSLLLLIFHFAQHVEHACAQHQGPIPPRPKYDALSAHGHAADWGGTCGNSAVGVYGYPKVLMEDVRGMNERLIHWGGMVSEAVMYLNAR